MLAVMCLLNPLLEGGAFSGQELVNSCSKTKCALYVLYDLDLQSYMFLSSLCVPH